MWVERRKHWASQNKIMQFGDAVVICACALDKQRSIEPKKPCILNEYRASLVLCEMSFKDIPR